MSVSHWGIFPGYFIAKYTGYTGQWVAMWELCDFDYLMRHS